ncbi:hypothetical protein ZHAS_00021063 [Anopheles sinensis]|uniref:Secreted protein n=1 Tax=Anopheles sinensis TaxID=74873 RepID=A0A084WRF2_ANOSI|nr:hypothetical protein ZHAS_00021063 [Anopheles sinensis]
MITVACSKVVVVVLLLLLESSCSLVHVLARLSSGGGRKTANRVGGEEPGPRPIVKQTDREFLKALIFGFGRAVKCRRLRSFPSHILDPRCARLPPGMADPSGSFLVCEV